MSVEIRHCESSGSCREHKTVNPSQMQSTVTTTTQSGLPLRGVLLGYRFKVVAKRKAILESFAMLNGEFYKGGKFALESYMILCV